MNIEIRDTLKRTPLLVAAECGYLDIIQLLVDYGADLTAKDKDMNSLLHCAAISGIDSNLTDVLHGILSL
jgi:ankyrin repeat protein